MTTFEFALWLVVVLFMCKEIYEVTYIRKRTGRFFDDQEYRRELMKDSLQPIADQVIHDLPRTMSVLVHKLRTDPEFEKEFYIFTNSLILNGFYAVKERTKAEVDQLIAQGGDPNYPIPKSAIKYPKGHMLKPYEAEVNMIADEIKREQFEKRQKDKKKGGGNPEVNNDMSLDFGGTAMHQ